MPRPKRLDARDQLASIREIGEELRNGDGESLYGRTGAKRRSARPAAKASRRGRNAVKSMSASPPFCAEIVNRNPMTGSGSGETALPSSRLEAT
jgi:hypothetical protein